MDTSLGQERPEAQIGKQPTIKMQTTLVMVPAIVTDRSGSHIDDLKEEDFQVSRNGNTQKINTRREISGSHGAAIRRIHDDFRSKRQYPSTDWISTCGN